MPFAPKVAPLVAELLSGTAFILILYVSFRSISLTEINQLSNGAIIAFAIVAWLLGTFFDAIRNLLESLWDRWKPINWRFFFDGEQTKLLNLDTYFWSFYMLDADITISILSAVITSAALMVVTHRGMTSGLYWLWTILLAIAFFFWQDARLLRREIKERIDEQQ